MSPVGLAVVGCGTISDEYLRNLTSFPDLRVLYCADLDVERAKAQAARYGVPAAGGAAQAVADPEVEIVVNLTIPAAHTEVALAALAAGKHVWIEKPLALSTADGRRLLAEADRAGRLVADEFGLARNVALYASAYRELLDREKGCGAEGARASRASLSFPPRGTGAEFSRCAE